MTGKITLEYLSISEAVMPNILFNSFISSGLALGAGAAAGGAAGGGAAAAGGGTGGSGGSLCIGGGGGGASGSWWSYRGQCRDMGGGGPYLP